MHLKARSIVTALLLGLTLATVQAADVPRIIAYQGWVQVGGNNYNGAASFKFAIVDASGTTTYWSHDGTSTGGNQPTGAAMTIQVTNGLFAVLLGDSSVAGMAAIGDTVFDAGDAHLKVWFDDGVNGYAQLGTAQKLVASPYAFRAQEALAMDSGAAASGEVLTADGTGGTTWSLPPGAGGGEANTGSNGGTLGIGVYDSKVGTGLVFRNLVDADGTISIVLDDPNNEIDLSVADASISNTKLSTMAAGTIKGNNTAGVAAPSDLTSTQVTAMLDEMGAATAGAAGAKGLVPAPAAGEEAMFLRGDGTWVAAGGHDPVTLGTANGLALTGQQLDLALATTTTAGAMAAADKTKLDGIETGATADQTAAEIKTAYESNADTNAFTDANVTKLSGIETGATADQTAAEIKTAYESNADTNAFTDANVTKLSGIEALADVTDATNVAAAGAVMDSDFSGTDGFMRKTGAGAYEVIKANLAATAAPTATDDSAAGYAVGSLWVDVTNDNSYICVDATATAAVWAEASTDHDAVTLGTANGLALTGQQLDLALATTTTAGAMAAADKTKLDGIETGATADQTAAEIKTAYESNADTNAFTDANVTKLSGIEALADVTDATNVAAAGAVMDSDFSGTDGFMRKTGAGAYEVIKANLAATAAPTATDDSAAGYAVGSLWVDVTNDNSYICVDATATAAVWAEASTDHDAVTLGTANGLALTGQQLDLALATTTTAGAMAAADKTKLDGIETGATADQTAAEIKTAYESNADTNAFTDANVTKLSGIETGATADQTAAEIKTAYESNADTNAFTDANVTKLSGIETLADVTDATNVAAAGAVMDSDFSGTDGFMRKTGAGAYEVIKANLAATAAPTATDDGTAGYAVGSLWVDTTGDKSYVCVDSTNAAAQWVETSPSATTPAGANTQIQFNNSGVFGANANLTWSGTSLGVGATTASTSTTTGALTVAGGAGIAGDLHVGGSFTGAQIALGAGTVTALDVSNATSISANTSAGAVVLAGFSGGVAGQQIKVFNNDSDVTDGLTLNHNDGTGTQKIMLPMGAASSTLVLSSYGGVTLICDGTNWFVIEQANTYAP